VGNIRKWQFFYKCRRCGQEVRVHATEGDTLLKHMAVHIVAEGRAEFDIYRNGRWRGHVVFDEGAAA